MSEATPSPPVSPTVLNWLARDDKTRVAAPTSEDAPTLDNDAFDALVDRFLSGAAPNASGGETRAIGHVTLAKEKKEERVCTSCKRRRLRDKDFEPDRKTCRECLRKQRRRHARKVRAELEKQRWKGKASEDDDDEFRRRPAT